MIYFLSVLQQLLFFLLITASSEKCPERNVIHVTGGIQEHSQTEYYYGTITTPNFPQKFPTPFNISYVIDASYRSNDSQIYVYLTQMYISRGVRFFQRPSLDFCNHNRVIPIKPGARHQCRKPNDREETEIVVKTLHDALHVSTSCPYLEIEVTVPELYGYHYRTRDPFLFDVYGFNITYEIVPERLGPKNDTCNSRQCSNLGHCYLAQNWRDFYCDCVKDHPGRYCNISPRCDPENNVTFCFNGGECRITGSGDGYCICNGTGHNGLWCEKRNEQPKVSARTGCSNANECLVEESSTPHCSPETSKEPCSCRPSSKSGKVIPNDWRKYEATISISQNFTMLQNQSSVGYELQKNISRWFRSHNLADLHNVLVSFHPPPHGETYPRPEKLLIHFYGPLKLQAVKEQLKQYLFSEEGTRTFRRQIPVINGSLDISIMPRLKYKSIEVGNKGKLRIGKSVGLTCTAVTGQSAYYSQRDYQFRWFKDGMPVNTSIATRHMQIFQNLNDEDETRSIIIIDDVSAFDGGIYTCEITDVEFGDQECGIKEVEVILPPQIEIEPMSLTLEKRKIERGVVITCTDGSYSANKSTNFMWKRTSGSTKELVRNDEVVVLEDIVPQGKLLRILRAEHSESFMCIAVNKEGMERSKIVNVKVLDSKNSPSCKQHWEPLLKHTEKANKLLWEWTAPNSLAMIPCPRGFIGFVQRRCILTGTGTVRWGRSDFSRCINERLRRINSTLQNAKIGFGDWQASNGVKLMTLLEKYLNMNQILYPGEGEKIVAIMEDIVKYTFIKGKVTGLMLQTFFGTVVKLLKIPNSCVQEKSVRTLCEITVEMAVRGALYSAATENEKLLKPHIIPSEILMLQILPINASAKHSDAAYVFPQKEAMANNNILTWLKGKLHVIFPLNSEGFTNEGQTTHVLVVAAYKNLSYLLIPSDAPVNRTTGANKKSFRTSIELITPVVQLFPENYYLPTSDSHIKIQFNLSKEHLTHFTYAGGRSAKHNLQTVKGTYYSCGALDNSSQTTKTDYGRLRWKMDACEMDFQYHGYVECQCKTLGIYGLLKVSTFEDEIPEVSKDIPSIILAGFSFCILSCVLSASVICVYLKCQICLNSLYSLKLFDCLFVSSALFIVLLGRTEIPSTTWLVWSASACSCLISSLSVQVTKTLRVLLMEASPNFPVFILPWLRNVSQVTLLSAITFSTVLPVWTATAAKLFGESSSNESAFLETSPVFAVFVATVFLEVLIFFGIFYKAVLKTNKEIAGYQQETAGSTVNTYTSEMKWILNYRLKTLHRSLGITLNTLIMTLGIVLYENLQQSIFIRYFLGFSTTAMGITLLLSYVSQSEYPLYLSICKPEKLLKRDPEKDIFKDIKGSQRKLYAISSEITGNGSIVGTTGLLPQSRPSVLRDAGRQLEDESETLSVSTVEEQSMDTFSTEMSFRTAPPPPPSQKIPVLNKRNNRSIRSMGSNTKSSNGSSYRGSRRISSNYSSDGFIPQPSRCRCLLSFGDYIEPSIRNTSINDRPNVQTESSATSSSSTYNNYLQINDQDEIQKKISHDLSILLPLHDKK